MILSLADRVGHLPTLDNPRAFVNLVDLVLAYAAENANMILVPRRLHCLLIKYDQVKFKL